MMRVDCGHVMCWQCVDAVKGSTRKCPMCRHVVTRGDRVYV